MATYNEIVSVKFVGDTSGLNASIKQAKNSLNGLKDSAGSLSGATGGVNSSIEDLKHSIESLRGLSVLDIILENWTNIGGQLSKSIGWAKQAGQEFLGAFNWKNFDMGDGKLKTIIGSMKVQLTEGFKSIGQSAKHMGAAIKAACSTPLAAVAALLGVVLSLVAAFKNALNTAKLLKQTAADAAKIGLSVQAYQQWGYVLESVGVQADELRGLIQTLSDEQAQMAEGSEGASKAFEALGLSMNDVINMSQEQLFTETIMRLQGVEDGVKRTQLAYQIFGEDAVHVANVMNMNNEQLRALLNNYNQLGGGASQALVNKSKELSLSVGQLKQAWTGLTNALAEVVMPVVTAVVNWLTKAIAIVRMFVQTIFGLDSSPASDAGSSMASGMSSYAGATNNATKAVQKLKREQMGFDELNKLPGKDSSSGSDGYDTSGLGAGFGGAGFTLPDVQDLGLDKWKAWFDEYKLLIQDIVTWGGIAGGLLLGVMCAMGGNWVGAIAGFAMAGLGFAVGSAKGGTFERFLADHQGLASVLKSIWTGLGDLFEGIFATIAAVAEFCMKVVISAFENGWRAIKAAWSICTSFFASIWATIEGIFSVVENVLAGNFRGAWEAIKKVLASWGSFFLNLFVQLSEIASAKTAFLRDAFDAAWKAIKKIFSGWGSFFNGLWTTIKNVFGNIGTSIANIVSSVIKSAVNGVLSKIESTVNNFINMINAAIGLINKIPGVNISKLSRISIPRLATGGIVTGSTLANIGENGKEAVLPLENNTQWMDMLADKIAARNSGPSKIVLSVDGKELGWASINGINSITKQTGNLQLQLV